MRLKIKSVPTLIFLSLLASGARSQDLSQYQKRMYINSSGDTLPYRILFPENYDRQKQYPLLVFLHGAGERGSDNEKQLTHGASLFLKPENRKNFPAIILFPQCAADNYWSSVQVDRSSMPLVLTFDYSKPPTKPLTSVVELVQKISKQERVRKSSIYIAGLSMGGMGTFEAVYRYPKLFAAAVPICGGGDSARYDSRVRKVPFWVFHGDKDGVVKVSHSRRMVNRLEGLKARVKYTEYTEVDHNSWDFALAEPEFLPWLFSHKR
jgi:predicted peptidase